MPAELVSPTIAAHPYGYTLPEGYIETPVDQDTGLPWCFAPSPDLPMPPQPGQNLERLGDWNHQYPQVEVWYSGNPILREDDVAKAALVNLRLQWVKYTEHHGVYNPYFIGPPQPATREQLAATITMGLAGFVPTGFIDLTGGKPRFRRSDEKEREWLWSSGQLRTACMGDVTRFLYRHVFSQDCDHINELELDEFLHTYNRERRLYLGHRLAAKMVERAVEPIEPTYASARRQGLISPAAPANPRDLVKKQLVKGTRLGRVDDVLHRVLGARHRQLVQLEAA